MPILPDKQIRLLGNLLLGPFGGYRVRQGGGYVRVAGELGIGEWAREGEWGRLDSQQELQRRLKCVLYVRIGCIMSMERSQCDLSTTSLSRRSPLSLVRLVVSVMMSAHVLMMSGQSHAPRPSQTSSDFSCAASSTVAVRYTPCSPSTPPHQPRLDPTHKPPNPLSAHKPPKPPLSPRPLYSGSSLYSPMSVEPRDLGALEI